MRTWTAIPDHPGFEAHPDGWVRRVGGPVPCGKGGKFVRHIKGSVMKGSAIPSTGYLQVMLPGRRKRSIHRLVALTFCSGYAPGLVVNHKNGNRTDNRAENLEWVTQAQNNLHAFRVLGRVGTCLGQVSKDHPTSKAIIATCVATGKETQFDCALDAVRTLNLDSGSISRCCHGDYKTHKGFRFRFADGGQT